MTTEYKSYAGVKVLVTGATGFTGKVLVKKLLEQGATVRAIARKSSRFDGLESEAVEWIRGDVFDPDVIRRAVDGIQYIFHVAAAYREAKITDDVYLKVHVTSTQLLAQAALKQPDFRRFLHVSTVGVHGHIEHPPANESSPFAPGDIYQRTKAAAETWITEFAKEQGLPLTVVRPAAIYGPGDRRLLKLFKLSKKPFFPVMGKGQGLYHFIHVDDLASIIMDAAIDPRAEGQIFIAGNEAPSKLQDAVTTIAAEFGHRPPRFIHIPSWPVFLAADLCETVCRVIKIEPPLYRRRVAFFTKDRSFDTSKLRNVLGYRQRVPIEDGLRQTARWYKENGWI